MRLRILPVCRVAMERPADRPAMDPASSLKSRLPQLHALRAHVASIVREGARPLPLTPLQTRIPGLGPWVLEGAGFYDLKITGGPLLRFEAVPAKGRQLDVVA